MCEEELSWQSAATVTATISNVSSGAMSGSLLKGECPCYIQTLLTRKEDDRNLDGSYGLWGETHLHLFRFYFMCMNILPAYMSVHHMCAHRIWKSVSQIPGNWRQRQLLSHHAGERIQAIQKSSQCYSPHILLKVKNKRTTTKNNLFLCLCYMCACQKTMLEPLELDPNKGVGNQILTLCKNRKCF